MFARFDENPAMTLRVIKETKRYGRTDGRMHGRRDARTDNVKTVYPLQTKFAGGIIMKYRLLVYLTSFTVCSGDIEINLFLYQPVIFRASSFPPPT